MTMYFVATGVVTLVGFFLLTGGSNIGREIVVAAINIIGKFIMPLVMAVGIWVRSIAQITINTLFECIYKLVPKIDYFASFFKGNDLRNVSFYVTAGRYFRGFAIVIAVFLFIFVCYKYFAMQDIEEGVGRAIARFAGTIVLILLSYNIVSMVGECFAETVNIFGGGSIGYQENFKMDEESPYVTNFEEALKYYGGGYEQDDAENSEFIKVQEQIENKKKEIEKKYDELNDASVNGTGTAYFPESSMEDVVATMDGCLSIVVMGYQIILVAIMVKILFNIVSMFFSLFERYIVWCVNYMLAPFFFAGFAAKNTANVFWAYIRTFLLQSFLMMIGIWSSRIIFEAVNYFEMDYKNMAGILFYAAVMTALTKIPSEIEKYFQSVGGGAMQTMGTLGASVMATVEGSNRTLGSTLQEGRNSSSLLTRTLPHVAASTTATAGTIGGKMHRAKVEKPFGEGRGEKGLFSNHEKLSKAASKEWEGGKAGRDFRGEEGLKALEAAKRVDTSTMDSLCKSSMAEQCDIRSGDRMAINRYRTQDGEQMVQVSSSRPETGITEKDMKPLIREDSLGSKTYTYTGKMDERGTLHPAFENGYYGKDSFKNPKEMGAWAGGNSLAYDKEGKKKVASADGKANFGLNADHAVVTRNNYGNKTGLSLMNGNEKVGFIAENGSKDFKQPGGTSIYDKNGNVVAKQFEFSSLPEHTTIENSKAVIQSLKASSPELNKVFEGYTVAPSKDSGGNPHVITMKDGFGQRIDVFDREYMMDMDAKNYGKVNVQTIDGKEIFYMKA